MRKFVPEGAKLIPPEGELKFTGEVYEVFQWPEPMFDGTTATFEMLRRPDTVKIVAVKDGKVVVTYQRQPRADWFYDFPGGKVETGFMIFRAARWMRTIRMNWWRRSGK